jgi:hypothetical protein
MRPKAPAPGSPQDWLRHARSDLALARGRKSELILSEHLCFHAHAQAVKLATAVLRWATTHVRCHPEKGATLFR